MSSFFDFSSDGLENFRDWLTAVLMAEIPPVVTGILLGAFLCELFELVCNPGNHTLLRFISGGSRSSSVCPNNSNSSINNKHRMCNDSMDPPKESEILKQSSSTTTTTKVKAPSVVDDLICPIELQLPYDPVMAEDSRIYERSAIEDYFKSKKGCSSRGTTTLISPITRKTMGTKLLPSPQTKNVIETLINTNVITGELAHNWKERCQYHQQKREMDELIKKANQKNGDPNIMYEVGLHYCFGLNGFPRQSNVAYPYFEKAHVAGHVKATFQIAIMFLKGWGVSRNEKEGIMYLGIAAAKGDCEASYELGLALADGKFGLQHNKEGAIMWLKVAIQSGGHNKEAAKKKLDEVRGCDSS